jgi:hypothetical protein
MLQAGLLIPVLLSWNRNSRNLNFALAEPEVDLDPDPTKSVVKKDKKIKNKRPTFAKKKLLLTLKRKDFVQFFVENCNKYCLRPEPNPELETGTEFFKVGTGTATNLYGSRTLADLDHIILGS